MIRLSAFGASALAHGAVVGSVLFLGMMGVEYTLPEVPLSAPPTPAVTMDWVEEGPPIDFEPEPERTVSLIPDEVKIPFEEEREVRELAVEPLPVKVTPAEPALERPSRLSGQKVSPSSEVETETVAVEFYNPPPPYPAAARRRRLEGEILLELTILADGRCGDVSVIESTGSRLFVDAAMDAVRTWSYVPAMRKGVAMDSTKRVRFTFRLRD